MMFMPSPSGLRLTGPVHGHVFGVTFHESLPVFLVPGVIQSRHQSKIFFNCHPKITGVGTTRIGLSLLTIWKSSGSYPPTLPFGSVSVFSYGWICYSVLELDTCMATVAEWHVA